MKINLEKGKVKHHERKNIGTLGRVKRKLSDNENAAASTALGVVIWPECFAGQDGSQSPRIFWGGEGT
jgi:hypothetical protein